MSDLPDNDGAGLYMTPFEKKCLDEWDKDVTLEERVQADSNVFDKKLWTSFQTCASSVSHLYKEGSQSNNVQLWVPFQAAAGAATVLYKDSQDMMRKSFELGTQLGGHRRTKEVLAWARKRRRTMVREDVIAYMCGRPIPSGRPHHKGSSFGRSCGRYASFESSSPRYSSPSSRSGGVYYPGEASGVSGFKDLPSFQGQISSPANTNVHRRPSQNNSPSRVSPPLRNNCHLDDSRAFFGEPCNGRFTESRKRTASGDARAGSDSPSSAFKRNRMDTDDY